METGTLISTIALLLSCFFLAWHLFHMPSPFLFGEKVRITYKDTGRAPSSPGATTRRAAGG
ncbi:hypothetical protein CA264_11865 [Pontibacter actiniarum]|uniref:Uncharacterized protein n=1 Tax=Pontibacter actiniarum TaxID=323450 RepID=A0A1X9YT76_9BACT|nr:hypothetical protein CA264_11865 [Pontibacter actiniarum]